MSILKCWCMSSSVTMDKYEGGRCKKAEEDAWKDILKVAAGYL